MIGEDIPISVSGGNMKTISESVVPARTLMPSAASMIQGPLIGMSASNAPAPVSTPQTR